MADGIKEMVSKTLGLVQKNRAHVEGIIAEWPSRPKLGAEMMLAKYGPPHEATEEQLIWRSIGPYKRITVTKAEHHHDFPKPHMDFLEHTVGYRVPPEKAAALSEYDGSCTFDRTRGELSARCDLEGHNILTLNLAHEIITGKINAEEARKVFTEIVVDDVKGKYPSYTTQLLFDPEGSSGARFPDTPTIPGSPQRPSGLTQPHGDENDGEVLGYIGAVDDLETMAALAIAPKKLRPEIAEFTKMLHEEHGRHFEETLKLGQQIGVTPRETSEVDKFRVQNAEKLADLLPLEGKEFETGYMQAKIKGHEETIKLIDSQLMPRTHSDALKQHLRVTREHLARHLEQAKSIQV
jgi:predicted outer membrane protein